MKKKLMVLSGFFLSLTPVVVLAQTTGGRTCAINPNQITTIQNLLCKLSEIFGAVIPVLIGLGVILFVWGVVMYVLASEEEAKKAGRDRMIYGIIGLAVIIGLWGLVRILTNTFGVDNAGDITFPTISP